jgi:endonuclease/exonuclease/phosphatase family metal-dependent hydrolase
MTRPLHPARGARRLLVGAIAALALVATIVAPATAAPNPHGERRIEVATYNLYLGANLQPLFGATGGDLVAAAAAVFAHVQQTDFPARAAAIAAQIAEAEPLVVGLQEVALWQTAPLSDPSRLTTQYDFLALLLDALAAAGHPYRIGVINANFSGMLPISATTLAAFTDRDAIIVRADVSPGEVKASGATPHTFVATLPVPLGGGTIQIPRGYSTIDLQIRGRAVRVVNTHLEAFNETVRNLQAQELAAAVAASPLPVVLLGDINSLPGDAAGAYGVLVGAGSVDGWIEAMGSTPGYTAGQTDDLNNVPSTIDHTVDYVFRSGCLLAALKGSGDILGEELDDRTPSGLWPSDHAGVVLTMRIAVTCR